MPRKTMVTNIDEDEDKPEDLYAAERARTVWNVQ